MSHSSRHTRRSSPTNNHSSSSSSSRNGNLSSNNASRTSRTSRRRRRRGSITTIQLDVYIDVLCPWCFIAKRSLEGVVADYEAEFAGVRFEVRWRPFYIMPGLAGEIDKRTLYERLYGTHPSLLDRLHASGTQHGITFSIQGPTGPSRQAHALIALSHSRLGSRGQARVVDRLFRGHFEQGEDIAEEGWLVSVGMEEGMAEGVVRGALQEGEGEEEREAADWVDEEVDGARARGVEAVPCVMVQGRYKIGGFQEADVFRRVFDRVRLGDAS